VTPCDQAEQAAVRNVQGVPPARERSDDRCVPGVPRLAGIERMQRHGVSEGEGFWRVDDLRIPVAGRWQLQVEILISDFEKLVLDEEVVLPRVP